LTRLVVFDCDGTLVDSQHVILDSMRAAFRAEGLQEPSAAAVRRIVGLSLIHAVAALLPGAGRATWEAVAERYKAAFHEARKRPDFREPLFPGARDALHGLEGAGLLLGVATGKSRRGLDAVLDHHGLRPLFVTLQTADDNPSKPHPAMLERAMAETGSRPAETAFVGDTTFDVEMALAAGVRAIGVAWGYHPPGELADAGAERVLDSFTELPPLVLPRTP
jgi:phosphoglycolate phosphatase